MKKFKGYGENIIVKVEKKKVEKKTASGIIIPDSDTKKEKYLVGEIISLDTEYFSRPEDIQRSDVVVFGLFDGLLLEETEDYSIYSILEKSIKALYV